MWAGSLIPSPSNHHHGTIITTKNERKRQNVADGSLAGDLASSPDLQAILDGSMYYEDSDFENYCSKNVVLPGNSVRFYDHPHVTGFEGLSYSNSVLTPLLRLNSRIVREFGLWTKFSAKDTLPINERLPKRPLMITGWLSYQSFHYTRKLDIPHIFSNCDRDDPLCGLAWFIHYNHSIENHIAKS
ncbi:hypothetical protein PCH_Pc21g21300 [Penicillium rubens Wisconsin 54-1255]|uniref:Uncharacterized protein n=1 Tax=Penicillium rubens (strain ATCC 28089 / DSM 1075 / NRRL 1951 / Wisconsin 54-1255) TaxID=500485 RepID=B6HLT3_PENRW|nr:hypothetical protein PCH_Pc21g21300 [Penicillium rubens Wisconsin 54-1255]